MEHNSEEIFAMNFQQLYNVAKKLDIKNIKDYKKVDLVSKIFEVSAEQEGLAYTTGCLDTNDDGTGFLRYQNNNYLPSRDDVLVSQNQIKKFNLKKGHMISGAVRSPKEGEKYFTLTRVDSVNGIEPMKILELSPFESLTPYYPTEKLNLEVIAETNPNASVVSDCISTRIVNLFSPIGKGQRGLIVAAPRTGKTVLMQNITNAILVNNPDVHVIVLLVDERPEEVTEMKKTIFANNSEVVSSTFDETAKNHTMVAEIVIEKAKRMVELNRHVVIVLDSITRLARAYNNNSPSSGKIMSGGIDANAMHRPKRFFGAARNIQDAGSLTIIATALVDTGSRMDQVIFEEFKGTGNMEIVLDRSISDMRVFPAIDLIRSGTRREELLLTQSELNRMYVLRKYLKSMNPIQGMETLKQKVAESKNNSEMLKSMSS
ncbi:MAG TPA: transcription termination factor Rho [Candidatus Cloacimonadota bacterium]|jgi:transcription termination factor Rho|nr:transcription termination factor Rho [Candidatus Cloacimonadales bacterium]HPY97085.1 transcription termination factor Rho [Candidatus Cloacimonadota bacterium]HQB41678.1 transcription termination factor Rho [Candidatus Cloacimonadota bacterium]